MSHITSPPRVPDASGLGREVLLAAMARAFETVAKLEDPNMRRVALRRADIIGASLRDQHAAIAILRAKRAAMATSVGGRAA